MSGEKVDLRNDIVNDSFIISVLKENYGDEIQYISHQSEVGTEKGDNFIGDLISCEVLVQDQVKNEKKSLHWMCKVMKRGKMAKFMEEISLFDCEEAFYKDFRKDLDTYVKPNLLRIVPLVHSANEEDKQVLVFEHLGFMGYRDPMNKKIGFNDEHVYNALTWLAELHGAGFVLLKKYPGGYEEWKKNKMYADFVSMEQHEEIYEGMADQLYNILEDLKNGSDNDSLLDSIIPLLKDFFGNRPKDTSVGKKMKDLLYKSRSNFKTLIHGDPWFNNIMVKYGKEDRIEDLILLDMQVIYSGNIGSDLAYFLISSVSYDNLSSKLDTYIEYYRNTLLKFVEEIDPDISLTLSFEDIKIDFIKSSLIGLIFALNVFPHVLVEKEDMIQLDFAEIDWTDADQNKYYAEKMRIHGKKMMHSKPLLYDRLIGAVRLISDLKVFDYLKY